MKPIRRLAVAVVVLSLMTATACQAAGDSGVLADTDPTTSGPAAAEGASQAPASRLPTSNRSPLATEDLALPPARGIDELAAVADDVQPLPMTVSIERLDLAETPVRTVGIENNGDMTVPPPRDVGWYQYGPAPGESGSAVLAGHIASGGISGAFRHLDRLEPGDVVTIGFDDGSSRAFEVDELFQVDKTELPFDTVFTRSGPAKLALITCGGDFDYDARSYEDNIVVTAVPLSG